ncbi:hypothetical protein ANOM_005302 [Aspergillus nomiae NRRL 13137]|uniref:Hydrophobin n=1 Tax=Aspergillus nomiae NRRL (strain ATCC 15546 / NRRL 13137 / CBS 260.88 / M93) TaxID=1509407 RepID=A0A0L1J6R8_ASPN3|nr:uncharacterized protein ANOM_005302 [Aspergillus nomiae NRRL 13137]KNG87113.1 hypothetical protein ANOM_005302 [Aspergillus nomiae NRRL 13137]
MRLAYLILSVFVAAVAAVPNQCTPNGLPCDSQTPCCSKLCVIKGDIGSPNENEYQWKSLFQHGHEECADTYFIECPRSIGGSFDKIDKLMEDPPFRTVDLCLAI